MVISSSTDNIKMGHMNFLHMPHINFNHHHNHNNGRRGIPKGCVVVTVGHEDEEHQRFLIPVMYVNHPLFVELLKEAEEEYGFYHDGPINIPCHVDEFCHVKGMIDQDTMSQHGHNRDRQDHNHYHNHHQFLCFKV